MDAAEFFSGLRCLGFVAAVLIVMWLAGKVFGDD